LTVNSRSSSVHKREPIVSKITGVSICSALLAGALVPLQAQAENGAREKQGRTMRLHIVEIDVPDVERARKFYKGILGLQEKRVHTDETDGSIVVVEFESSAGPAILLHRVKEKVHAQTRRPIVADEYPSQSGLRLIFAVDDIDKQAAELVRKNVELIRIPWAPATSKFGIAESPYGRFIQFKDPFGNVHELIEEAELPK
jgi:catechol 2,3-dioxygenase-like lactoylglutathione lyase family enzyme